MTNEEHLCSPDSFDVVIVLSKNSCCLYINMYINIYWGVGARMFICTFSSVLNPGKYLLLVTCHSSKLHRLAEDKMGAP